MKYECPCCGKEVDETHFVCKQGAKGGASGKGAVKARSSEQARAAVMARWAKKKGEVGKPRITGVWDETGGEVKRFVECEGRNEQPGE